MYGSERSHLLAIILYQYAILKCFYISPDINLGQVCMVWYENMFLSNKSFYYRMHKYSIPAWHCMNISKQILFSQRVHCKNTWSLKLHNFILDMQIASVDINKPIIVCKFLITAPSEGGSLGSVKPLFSSPSTTFPVFLESKNRFDPPFQALGPQ